MSNKKKVVFVTIICTLLIGIFVLFNTYAYWKAKGEQSGSNLVVGACLDLEFTETPNPNNPEETVSGFDLIDTFPTYDEDGLATTGYTFKIKNKCADDVNYQIVLESLKTPNENYFDNKYIKVYKSDRGIYRYSQLDVVDNDPKPTVAGEILETRKVFAGVIPGTDKDTEGDIKSEVTHTIKMWLSDDAGNDQIGKEFKSRIKVFAGQGIEAYPFTPDECFVFDSDTGTITDYNKDNPNCGTESLVVPNKIAGVTVKDIIFSNKTYCFNSTEGDNCIRWKHVDLSNLSGLEKVSKDLFYYYFGYDQTLELPNNIKIIDDNAFNYFTGKTIKFPEELERINTLAFSHYHGGEFTLPDKLQFIGYGAFDTYQGDYNGVKHNLVIPASVTTIDYGAFYLFNGNSITFNEGLQTIGEVAFANYNGNDIIIPSTITKIGESAFYSMDNTKTIYFKKTPSEFANVRIFSDRNRWRGNATVLCLNPDESTSATTPWVSCTE